MIVTQGMNGHLFGELDPNRGPLDVFLKRAGMDVMPSDDLFLGIDRKGLSWYFDQN